MVQIEILPYEDQETNYEQKSFEIPHSKSSSSECGDTFTIVALAKVCAAVQIQAIWKGVLCRKYKYKVNASSSSSQEEASLLIQKSWRKYKKSKVERRLKITFKNGSCNGLKKNNFGFIDNIATEECKRGDQAASNNLNLRRKVIKLAYDVCSRKLLQAVTLSGFEVLNILQALSMLLPNEYEMLSKSVMSEMTDNGDRHKGRSNNNFTVRLTGSLMDFVNDVKVAWKRIIQRTVELSPSKAIFLKRNRHRVKEDSSSHIARSHLFKLCTLSDESLSILENKENIISYNNDVIQCFLSSLGIDTGKTKDDDDKTLFDYLYLQLEMTESSFIRTKIKCALEVVHFVVEFERLGENICLLKTQKFDDSIIEKKDQMISILEDEVQRLKVKLRSLERHNCHCNKDELFVKDDFNAKRERGSEPTTKLVSKSLRPRSSKQSIKNKIPTNVDSSIMTKKKNHQSRKKQESVNCIEIKFDDFFEKELNQVDSYIKAPFPQPKHHPWNHVERKQSSKAPSFGTLNSRKPKSSITLTETLAKARGKRLYNVNTKIAWSDTSESKQSEQSSKQQHQIMESSALFREVRNSRDDEIKDIQAPEVRFNSILEKLRKTASEFKE